MASTAVAQEREQSRVLNGEKVLECGFAPVAFLGNCTGTLVHPEIVLHAQHCGKPKRISLTHGGRQGKRLEVEYCKTYPGRWSTAKDFAFCKLKKPVTDIPPIPVAFGCEVDKIVKDAEIVHCGFGANGGSSSGTKGGGIKRWGPNTIGSLRKSGEFTTISTSPGKIVSCAGDSGGPLLMRLPDKSWRVVGIASTINGGGCNGTSSYNSYSLAAPGVAWVEKESGVDITPCFDPDGTWSPTKDCGKFYMGDQEGHGTWADGCKGTPISGFSSTCGDPFGKDEGEGKDGDGGDDGDGDSEGSSGEDTSEESSTTGATDPDQSEEPGEGDQSEDPKSTPEDSEKEDGDAASEEDANEEDEEEKSDEDDPSAEPSDGKPVKKGCSLSSGPAPIWSGLVILALLGLRRRKGLAAGH